MPEGDTIFRTAAALHRALAGAEVVHFETGLAHLARVDDDAPIRGRVVERCESIGKHVLIWFSGDLALRTHMRMSGSWHLYRPGEAWQRPARDLRVRLDTDRWVAVAFNVPVAEFISRADLPRSRALAALGPDLLAADFDRPEALRRLAQGGTRRIEEVILDQRVVAGIGNVFKSEVLFLCGIRPDRAAEGLTADERIAILDTAIPLLRRNTGRDAGPEIVTYRGLRRTTRRARPEDSLWVYGRAGRPCRTCGTPIAVSRRGINARPTYWCPQCQR
jgi:endonuclease VIII